MNPQNLSKRGTGAAGSPSRSPQSKGPGNRRRKNSQKKDQQSRSPTQAPKRGPRYAGAASDDDTDSNSGLSTSSRSQSRKRSRPVSTSPSKQTQLPTDQSQLAKLDDSDDEDDLPLTNTNLGLIRSDDIDGPTDFTENIEYWMKLRLPSVKTPTSMEEGEQKSILEEWIASDPADEARKSPVKDTRQDDEAATQSQTSKTNDTRKMFSHSEHVRIIQERNQFIRVLESELAESRRKNDVAAKEQLTTNTRLKSDLTTSHQANIDLRNELAALKKSTEEMLSRRQNTFDAEMQELKQQHQEDLAAQRPKSSSSSLAETWSANVEREAEIKRLKSVITAKESKAEELERESRERVDDLESAVRSKDERVKAMERELLDTKGQLASAQGELRRSQDTNAELQLQVDSAVSESRIARETHEDEIKEASRRHRTLEQAVERAEKKAGQVDGLRQQLRAMEEVHEEEAQRLRDEHETQLRELRGRAETAVKKASELLDKERRETSRIKSEVLRIEEAESDGKNELLLLNDQVDDLARERDDLASKLDKIISALEKEQGLAKKSKSEGDVLRKELVELRMLNEETEKKMVSVVAEREGEWKRRMAELRSEMELRSKLLMIEWGRREVGAEKENVGLQGYKYLFREGEFVRS